ncbi:MAG TPA: AMP-binding protein, partial [Hyphomonas sp.]|nr:AMP-binding protein [Hyphomonas sp.]
MSHYSMPQALFPDVFRLHGRSRPTREAMICGQTRYDWRTFNNRLNQVANAALAENLKPGDRVIVLMANGTEMIETLFGLIKA